MNMKKNKGIPFDEFYSNGYIDLGRIGNLVTMRNHFTEEDIASIQKNLAEQYEEKKTEIDDWITDIRNNISICNPLLLLMSATDRGMMNLINTVSESQLNAEENFKLRATEYIQSILVSQESNYKEADDEQVELIEQILLKVDKLYESIPLFYNYWSAKALNEDETLTREDISYIIEAQLMGNVRGKRYQFQQLNTLETLLMPHSAKLLEIYNISSWDILEGLKKLEKSLSAGKLDAMKEMMQEFDDFQKESAGKSLEEVKVILDKIRDDSRHWELSRKCFGSDLYNVKLVTRWSDELVNSLSWGLGESTDFIKKDEFSAWPMVDLPVQKKPFIKINQVSYCFDYYNLFDNIYRIIQKDVSRHDNNYKWADIQKEASEALVEMQFKKLLPGCQSYIGNYYPIENSLKQMDENDILILYDDTILIVEVKAGSFTYTPAITDYKAHKKSFENLIGKADYQCERTLKYINKKKQVFFYDEYKNIKFTVDNTQYKNIFTFCVTVENFNAFEAKIEKMNFLKISSGTIAISVDDLDVYVEYFESPLYFLHYLRQRKAATMLPTLMLNDELDHLGMYIVHNNYAMFASEFGECSSFVANGYREDLDGYFAGLYYKGLYRAKPIQEIPDKLRDIICFVQENELQGRVSFVNFLLDLAPVTRNELIESIQYLLERQKEVGRMFPVIKNGDMMYGCFVLQKGIQEIDERFRLSYMYANMMKVKKDESWYVFISYDDFERINDVQYRKLYIDDIDKEGYDRNTLEKIAEIVYANRVKNILEKENKKKIYPNDPCPCGSGKKYKKCCGKK